MSRNPFRRTVGFYEVGETRYATTSNNSSSKGNPVITKPRQMATSYSPPTKPPSQESPKNVGFDLKDHHKEEKKKYLTAKYGAHQMLLIKKRLNVEMWVFDELRKLYNSPGRIKDLNTFRDPKVVASAGMCHHEHRLIADQDLFPSPFGSLGHWVLNWEL